MKGCTSHSLGNMYLIRAVNQRVQQSRSLQGCRDGQNTLMESSFKLEWKREGEIHGGSNEKIPRAAEKEKRRSVWG